MFLNLLNPKVQKQSTIYAPVSGKMIPLEKVNDAVFSQRMAGNGVAIAMEDDYVYAPCDCEVILIAKTLHAVGLKIDDRIDLLIHVGIDTVNLNGQGFTCFIHPSEFIKKGDRLLKIDRKFMLANHIDITTCIIVTNSSEIETVELNASYATAMQTEILLCQ